MEHNVAPPSHPDFLAGPNGRIAYRRQVGHAPTVVWLGGYASDMLGTKASALSAHAARTGQGYLRFDYTGHGESEGRFQDGTISRWLQDAGHAIRTLAPGRKVLVGSSMGAWITLLHAMKHPAEIEGIVLVAPAPDFTERLLAPRLGDDHREALVRDGIVCTGEPGDLASTYTRALFEDGRANLIMDGPITVPCAVTILHGMADNVVPTAHVIALAEAIDSPSLSVQLTKQGDHRRCRRVDVEPSVD